MKVFGIVLGMVVLFSLMGYAGLTEHVVIPLVFMTVVVGSAIIAGDSNSYK